MFPFESGNKSKLVVSEIQFLYYPFFKTTVHFVSCRAFSHSSPFFSSEVSRPWQTHFFHWHPYPESSSGSKISCFFLFPFYIWSSNRNKKKKKKSVTLMRRANFCIEYQIWIIHPIDPLFLSISCSNISFFTPMINCQEGQGLVPNHTFHIPLLIIIRHYLFISPRISIILLISSPPDVPRCRC